MERDWMDDDERAEDAIPPTPADIAAVLIGFAAFLGFVGFLCWRVWPYIAHAGMH